MSQLEIMEPGALTGFTRTPQPRKTSVWMCCPTKRPPAESEPIFVKWRERGYKIAVVRDEVYCGAIFEPELQYFSVPIWGRYPGYAVAQNHLIRTIFDTEPACDWIVAAADDLEPDANHTAEEVARQCSEHFAKLHAGADAAPGVDLSIKSLQAAVLGVGMRTFGVAQATGDRWGLGDAGGGPDKCYADMVAGSPWIGRSFARRAYGGRGPYWPEYSHMYCDNELRAVAMKLGCYWERRDLIHMHRHWGRPREGERLGLRSRMPAFLAAANDPVNWDVAKRMFETREKLGFPGHEVIG